MRIRTESSCVWREENEPGLWKWDEAGGSSEGKPRAEEQIGAVE